MRTETDALGLRQLPDDTLYGINTLRAAENFNLNHKCVHKNLIYAMVKVKKAAAITYKNLGVGKSGVYSAIISACNRVLSGECDSSFITQALQGGAGTSTNMNVNEVLANLALKEMGYECGRYDIVHPLDDVNRGQSTNDVYPTALRIAAIEQLRILSDECAKLQEELQRKENEFEDVAKLGRTELMDAVQMTLGNEFGAYAQAIARDRWRIYKIEERLRQVNIGGTAIGLATNAMRKYRYGVIEQLRLITGIGLASAEYPVDVTQNNDVFVEVSGLLKAMAVNMTKIANDLRLMNSGPYGGIGEISLQKLQQGSSIMPGKVNPVIPEMVMQVSMRVMSNDSAITMAAAHGEFELNAFAPLIAECLLESLELLINTARLFRQRCIKTLKANEKNCRSNLDKSYAFATPYAAKLGYDVVSRAVNDNPPEKARAILDKLAKETEKE